MPQPYFGTLTYIVAPGDTLFSIAHAYNSTVGNILKFNTIGNPNLIYVGQQIIIPLSPPEAIIYTVKSGDNLSKIASMFHTLVSNLIKYNYLTPPYIIFPGQQIVVTASLR